MSASQLQCQAFATHCTLPFQMSFDIPLVLVGPVMSMFVVWTQRAGDHNLYPYSGGTSKLIVPSVSSQEGEVSQKLYAEFAEWCEDRSKDLGFEIKTGKATVDDLKAAGTALSTFSPMGSIRYDEHVCSNGIVPTRRRQHMCLQ